MAQFSRFLGHNSLKLDRIWLKFSPELVQPYIQAWCNAFWTTLIFASAGRFGNFCVWSNFGPNLPPEGVRNRKKKNFHDINSDIGPSEYANRNALAGPNFSGKIRLLFAVFCVFLVKKGQKLYEGDFKSRVSTTFSKAPPCGLTAPERISFVAHGKLE